MLGVVEGADARSATQNPAPIALAGGTCCELFTSVKTGQQISRNGLSGIHEIR